MLASVAELSSLGANLGDPPEALLIEHWLKDILRGLSLLRQSQVERGSLCDLRYHLNETDCELDLDAAIVHGYLNEGVHSNYGSCAHSAFASI